MAIGQSISCIELVQEPKRTDDVSNTAVRQEEPTRNASSTMRERSRADNREAGAFSDVNIKKGRHEKPSIRGISRKSPVGPEFQSTGRSSQRASRSA